MKSRFKKNLNIIIDAFAYAEFVFMASTGLLMHFTLPAGSGHHTTVWGLDRHEWGTLHFWLSVAFLATLALHLILHWNWIVAILRGKKTESSGLRFGLGLFGLIALLILAFTPLISPVEKAYYPRQQKRLQQTETVPVETIDESRLDEVEQTGSQQIQVTEESGSQQTTGREGTGSQRQSSTERSADVDESDSEYSFNEVSVRGYMTLKQVSEEYGVSVSHILNELGLPANTDRDETFGRLRRIYDFEMHDVRRIILEYQETK